jgi:hypothetical protein
MKRVSLWEECPLEECNGGLECKRSHGKTAECEKCSCNRCTQGKCWTQKEDIVGYLTDREFVLLGFPGPIEIYRKDNIIVKVEER